MKFIEIFLRCHFPGAYTYFYDPGELDIIKWIAEDCTFNDRNNSRSFRGRVVYGYAKSPWYCTRPERVLVRERKQEEISPGTFETVQSILYYPESAITSRKTCEILTYYSSGNRTIRWILGYHRNLKKRVEGEWNYNGYGVVEFRDTGGKVEQKSQVNLFKKHGFTRLWGDSGIYGFKFYIDGVDHTAEISTELGYDIEVADEIPEADRTFIKLKYMECT